MGAVPCAPGMPHFSCVMRSEANDQWTFAAFVISLVEAAYIRSGMTLIVDSAKIHTAQGAAAVIDPVLRHAGAQMKLLPTYSPELNPIELVWAKAKKVMRETRDTSVSFRSEVIRCLAAVTAADVYNFYVHVLTWWSQRLRNEFGLDATKST